jgi:hypothetical protein
VSFARFRPVVLLALVSVLGTGYSSCAGGAGPLLGPLLLTPHQVLLRASLAAKEEAVGLARVDGGEPGDTYEISIEYGKGSSGWLTVETNGADFTLHASPGGLVEGVYLAEVSVHGRSSGAGGALQVEFTVIP